ncbi:hypothetical protein FGO68_gene12246 [Halteria grandinella]|uniref:Uncharacterized protein n=1 Tax=Halteria grandinella TaxID=5974 RepID=A0A8J8SXZ2_HALGN|nr:hypothetical protein FGO68_gene12246 [Halteria grandinella]
MKFFLIYLIVLVNSTLDYPYSCDCQEHDNSDTCAAHQCLWNETEIGTKKCRVKDCSERDDDVLINKFRLLDVWLLVNFTQLIEHRVIHKEYKLKLVNRFQVVMNWMFRRLALHMLEEYVKSISVGTILLPRPVNQFLLVLMQLQKQNVITFLQMNCHHYFPRQHIVTGQEMCV